MCKYKVGDRIKNVDTEPGNNSGKYGTVERVDIYYRSPSETTYEVAILYDDGCKGASKEAEKFYKIINKTVMQKINIFAKKLLDKNTKTLIEAGYLNENLDLTSQGSDALELIAFDKYALELVAMAEAKIEEDKKSKE